MMLWRTQPLVTTVHLSEACTISSGREKETILESSVLLMSFYQIAALLQGL